MDDTYVKSCVVCNTESNVDDFYNNYRKGKQCNIRRVLKRYHKNKDDISQKHRDKYARFTDLDNRLKALEEKFAKNDSESK